MKLLDEMKQALAEVQTGDNANSVASAAIDAVTNAADDYLFYGNAEKLADIIIRSSLPPLFHRDGFQMHLATRRACGIMMVTDDDKMHINAALDNLFDSRKVLELGFDGYRTELQGIVLVVFKYAPQRGNK
jgi:hypothetical protein